MATARAPQDRKPRQRKPTAAELAVEPTDLERVEAEAEALDAEWVLTPLRDQEVRVLPFRDWPRPVYRAIARGGDFDAITEVVHPDDLDAVDGLETIGDLADWVLGILVDGGQSLGESVASKASSRTMRRR